jgi:hypothetical protein
VPNGIDAAVNRVEATNFEPMADCPPSNAEINELRPRNHAMLTLGKLSDQLVDARTADFCPYDGLNCDLVGHA